jgi:curved DNA-binding protein CbpA
VTNHYKVLGLSNTASQAEIRRSFRNLALKYHPDRNKNSEESKQKFMQIVEAYEVLSDQQSRKNYDSNMNYYHHGSYNYTPRSRKWNYSADFDRIYRYTKRRYVNDLISRSSDMRYIGKTTSAGIRKAPMILFRSLSSVIRSASVTTSTKE